MNTSSSPTCAECGRPVPTVSQHQICPACLMAQAMASRTIDGTIDGTPATASSPPPSPEEIADKFPHFEITECLGRGGMGVVYKARQKSLNRWVAIKILAPEKTHDEKFAERFTREAHTLALLNHPNIVTVYDHGETDGLFYIVMEFVDGVNLRDLLREGKLEDKQALAIVPPICEALQYAHDKGIVHRDIKPENLLLDRDGRVKIADFGIASLVGASGESSGTPPYMAPEQSGGPADHRADIYALGVVLYEMLTGERPAKEVVAPSRKVQVDVRLDGIVLRALEKMPELRYHNAGEFRTAVETIAPQVSTVLPEPASSPRLLVNHRRASFAAAVTIFYAGVVFSILFIGVLPFRFSRDHAHLLGVGLMLVVTTFVGMAVAEALRKARVDAEDVRWQKLAARLKAASVVAWLLTVPFIGFAIFFLYALLSERGGWNPALSEAMLVPLTWLGAVLLPISGSLLWKAAKADSNGSKPAPSLSSKAGLMNGKVLVGTRLGQRIIVWPNVVAFFLLVVMLASLGGLPFLALRLGLMEILAVPIFGAAIMTGVGIVSGLKAPLDQLTDLDQPESRFPSSAAKQPSRSTGQTIALGCGMAVLVVVLLMMLSGALYFGLFDRHGKTTHNDRSQQSDKTPAHVLQAPPFIGDYPGGTVELVALATYPEEKSQYWLPNGTRTSAWPFPKQDPGSSAGGKKMRLMAVRVRSQNNEKSPALLRFDADSPHTQLGSSHDFNHPDYTETIRLFGVNPDVLDIDFKIGVTGEWETFRTLNPAANAILPNGSKQGSDSASTSDGWECGVQRILAPDGSTTVSFRYSKREDYKTRMVVVRVDGSKQKIKSGSLNTTNGVTHGMATFTAGEAAQIVAFEAQRQPYHWVTFQNVSVEPDHATTVEVKDLALSAASQVRFPQITAEMLLADVPADFKPSPENMERDALSRLPDTKLMSAPTITTTNKGEAVVKLDDKNSTNWNKRFVLLPEWDGKQVKFSVKAGVAQSKSPDTRNTQEVEVVGTAQPGQLTILELGLTELGRRYVGAIRFKVEEARANRR